MPTIMTHAALGWGLARAARRRGDPSNEGPDGADPLARRREVLAIALAMLPDLDVVTFRLGIPYAHPLGHRGLSHSLLAGAVFGLAAWLLLRLLTQEDTAAPSSTAGSSPARVGALDLLVLCLAACSHGPLDMLTGGGGLGVALLAPFDHARLFFPIRPIPVSPIGLRYFLTSGLPVLAWEVVLLWPLAALGWLATCQRPPRPRAAAATLVGLTLVVAWCARLWA